MERYCNVRWERSDRDALWHRIENIKLTQISMILVDSWKSPRKAVSEWRRALEDVFDRFRLKELANGAVIRSGGFTCGLKTLAKKTFFERSMNIYSNLTFEPKEFCNSPNTFLRTWELFTPSMTQPRNVVKIWNLFSFTSQNNKLL